jgi:uncharacterized alpha-E superfamily protein
MDRRGDGLMLSRVADYLYWMARNLERAEDTARLINAISRVLLDLPRGATFGWDVLVRVMGLDKLFAESYPSHDEASTMRFLIADPGNPSSILSCIQAARENCRRLRDVLPRACFERINAMYLRTRTEVARATGRSARTAMLEELIVGRQGIDGLLSECMSHDIAYQFIRLGEHIERADMTTRIVDIHAAVLVPRRPVAEDPTVALLWVGVLRSLSAYQMYRRHGSAQVTSAGVVNFLVNDPHFPRSVRHCLDKIELHLSELPHNLTSLRALRRAQRRIDRLSLDSLSPSLRHEYLDAVQSDLARIHDEVAQEYFHYHEQQSTALRAEAA